MVLFVLVALSVASRLVALRPARTELGLELEEAELEGAGSTPLYSARRLLSASRPR